MAPRIPLCRPFLQFPALEKTTDIPSIASHAHFQRHMHALIAEMLRVCRNTADKAVGEEFQRQAAQTLQVNRASATVSGGDKDSHS